MRELSDKRPPQRQPGDIRGHWRSSNISRHGDQTMRELSDKRPPQRQPGDIRGHRRSSNIWSAIANSNLREIVQPGNSRHGDQTMRELSDKRPPQRQPGDIRGHWRSSNIWSAIANSNLQENAFGLTHTPIISGHEGHHVPASTPVYKSHGSASLFSRNAISGLEERLSHPLARNNVGDLANDLEHNKEMLVYRPSKSIGYSHCLPMSNFQPNPIYIVQFKRTQKTFKGSPHWKRDLQIGTYVKVEANCGEDLGIVVGRARRPSPCLSILLGAMGEMPLKKITSLAGHNHVIEYGRQRSYETGALQVCLKKVQEMGMPMVVVDAEYQFDMRKLTFFFKAETRVDFRQLVHELYPIFQTRIWMHQLNSRPSYGSTNKGHGNINLLNELSFGVAKFRMGFGGTLGGYVGIIPKLWPLLLTGASHAFNLQGIMIVAYNRLAFDKPAAIYQLFLLGRESFIAMLMNCMHYE